MVSREESSFASVPIVLGLTGQANDFSFILKKVSNGACCHVIRMSVLV